MKCFFKCLTHFVKTSVLLSILLGSALAFVIGLQYAAVYIASTIGFGEIGAGIIYCGMLILVIAGTFTFLDRNKICN